MAFANPRLLLGDTAGDPDVQHLFYRSLVFIPH